jgi:hypothetical protein
MLRQQIARERSAFRCFRTTGASVRCHDQMWVGDLAALRPAVCEPDEAANGSKVGNKRCSSAFWRGHTGTGATVCSQIEPPVLRSHSGNAAATSAQWKAARYWLNQSMRILGLWVR